MHASWPTTSPPSADARKEHHRSCPICHNTERTSLHSLFALTPKIPHSSYSMAHHATSPIQLSAVHHCQYSSATGIACRPTRTILPRACQARVARGDCAHKCMQDAYTSIDTAAEPRHSIHIIAQPAIAQSTRTKASEAMLHAPWDFFTEKGMF